MRKLKQKLSKKWWVWVVAGLVVFFSGVGLTLMARWKLKQNALPVVEAEKVSVDVSLVAEVNEEERIVVVMVNVGEEKMVGVDVVVEYDRERLAFVKVEMGSMFADPKMLGQMVNEEKGLITVGMGSFEGASGRGEVMKFVFRSIKEGRAQVSLDQSTQVALLSGKVADVVFGERVVFEMGER